MHKTQKKRGLGLGLANLLGDIDPAGITTNINQSNKNNTKHLPIDMLKPGKYQPRHGMNNEALADLANSIRAHGIIQPIIVRNANKGYEIVAGERRWRAAALANIHEVPVIIRDITDEQTIALSLIENIQREDLNVIDTAIGLKRLIDEFGMTHESASSAVGKSRATVTNLLRLLDLSEEIKNMIRDGKLEMGHARALLALHQNRQLFVAKIIFNKNLSVRATENLIRQLSQQQKTPLTKKTNDPNIFQLQKKLSDKLLAPVNIKHTKDGKGKIIIKYNTLDELDGLLERFA